MSTDDRAFDDPCGMSTKNVVIGVSPKSFTELSMGAFVGVGVGYGIVVVIVCCRE